jgi:hypothetical protein
LARANPKAPRRPRGEARLTPRQRLSWLRLIRSENVGPATFRALVNEFGGAEAAIAALPLLSRRGGRAHDIRLCTEAEAEAEFAAAESLGADLVAIGEPGYPPALAQVDAPPPLLYAKGKLDLADIPIVSWAAPPRQPRLAFSPLASSSATLIKWRGKASGRCGRPVSALQASWRVKLRRMAGWAYTACWRPGSGPCHSILPCFASISPQVRLRIVESGGGCRSKDTVRFNSSRLF